MRVVAYMRNGVCVCVYVCMFVRVYAGIRQIEDCYQRHVDECKTGMEEDYAVDIDRKPYTNLPK